jgi:hypothetical protein
MANINTGKWLINRRHALRGIGAAVALPMLECMRPMQAAENTPQTIKRSVFVYIPNGVNTLTWQIQQAGIGYELTAPMASLERHRENITPISGLHHPDVLGKHHLCEKVWLTGAKVPRDGGPFRNSVSADQLIAEVQGVHTRFPSLEIAITGGSLAWSREGIQLPAERSPAELFKRLYGVEAGGAEEKQRNLDRRRSALDLVLDDAKKLRTKIGSRDKSRLDDYLAAVRQVEVRTLRAANWLNVPKPEVDEKLAAQLNRNISTRQAGDYYRTIYDLIVLALRTDMTRVVTCMTGSEAVGLAIPEIGIAQTRHELSHHNGDPEQLRRLTQTDTFLVEQFSYFLDQLVSYTDEGESLLDTTQVLWGSGMSYGHSHGTANLPLILAGGKSIGIKHGQHVDFNLPKIEQYNTSNASGHYAICGRPVDSSARFSNLLVTMLQRADVKTDSFYDSLGTISEVVA